MKLKEVFDSPQSWKQIQSTSSDPADRKQPNQANKPMWGEDSYNFRIGGNKYIVRFPQGVSNEFQIKGAPDDIPKQFDYVSFELNDSDEIMGTGNAYKVFSTVLDIIKNHKRRVGVPVLAQAKGNEPSRIKLYSRMFDKIASHKWETKISKDDFEAETLGGEHHVINWMI